MSVIKSGVVAHDNAILLAEGQRQVSVAAAGNNQSSVRAAEITFARAALTSCKTNNNGSGAEQFVNMLREMGVWS
jgi:hypothetical protein